MPCTVKEDPAVAETFGVEEIKQSWPVQCHCNIKCYGLSQVVCRSSEAPWVKKFQGMGMCDERRYFLLST